MEKKRGCSQTDMQIQVLTKYYVSIVHHVEFLDIQDHIVQDEIITFDERQALWRTSLKNNAKAMRNLITKVQGQSQAAYYSLGRAIYLSASEVHGKWGLSKILITICSNYQRLK